MTELKERCIIYVIHPDGKRLYLSSTCESFLKAKNYLRQKTGKRKITQMNRQLMKEFINNKDHWWTYWNGGFATFDEAKAERLKIIKYYGKKYQKYFCIDVSFH